MRSNLGPRDIDHLSQRASIGQFEFGTCIVYAIRNNMPFWYVVLVAYFVYKKKRCGKYKTDRFYFQKHFLVPILGSVELEFRKSIEIKLRLRWA